MNSTLRSRGTGDTVAIQPPPSAVNLKFQSFAPQAHVGTSNSKPHQNHKVASAPLIPKFASEVSRARANFGIGALVRGHGAAEAQSAGECLRLPYAHLRQSLSRCAERDAPAG